LAMKSTVNRGRFVISCSFIVRWNTPWQPVRFSGSTSRIVRASVPWRAFRSRDCLRGTTQNQRLAHISGKPYGKKCWNQSTGSLFRQSIREIPIRTSKTTSYLVQEFKSKRTTVMIWLTMWIHKKFDCCGRRNITSAQN